MKWLGWIIACLFLQSCATQKAAKLHYYLLSPIESVPSYLTDNPSSTIRIRQIVVADYLKSRSLVMQLPTHKLYYSKSHLWSEDLQKGFARALSFHMQKVAALEVSDWTTPLTSSPDVSLVVQLQHFLPTNDANVVLSGRYWLYEGESETSPILTKAFHYTAKLKDDGYAQSVKQMSQLVAELGLAISQQIEEVSTQ